MEFHGPENAEHELKKAFNLVVEAGVTHFWDRRPIPGTAPHEVVELYRQAFDACRSGNRLQAERLARATKHLARALWHEAKLAYFEPRAGELPALEEAREEYNLHETAEGSAELLESMTRAVPHGMTEMPGNLKRYLMRGKRHLSALAGSPDAHELVRAERIKAAHEYGRTLECLLLAHEATTGATGPGPQKAA